jgi:DNA-binding NarL/FixJ family response regulator
MEQPRPRPSGPILVVDDDAAFRDLLVVVLAHFGYPTREAASGEEALEAARREPPRLAVLDVCLPGIAGYQVCRQLRDEFGNELPIIFVSGERTQSYDRVAGFLVGADDYLVKPFALDEFVARVRRHLERTRAPAALAAALTTRESEVLRLLGDGFGRGEIANRLFISPKTAGTHIERVFKKLDVHSRAEAISFAYRHGLLESRHEQPTLTHHA